MSNEDLRWQNLIEIVKERLNNEVPSTTNIKQLLLIDPLLTHAKEIIEIERRTIIISDTSDGELLEALADAIVKGLQNRPPHITVKAISSFKQNLKAIASGSNNRYLIFFPIEANIREDVIDHISTLKTIRVAISQCASNRELTTKVNKACQKLGQSFPLEHLELPHLSSAIFLISAQGSAETALNYAKAELHICRDAARFAKHVKRKLTGLDPLWATSAPVPVIDVFLWKDTGRLEKKIVRREDFRLDDLSLLNDPKTRNLYDAAARLLEICPESVNPDKQTDFYWRVARSIRAFSRAVGECNQDVRFLLLLVAFEALVNRKEAPIAEAFAEYGALISAQTIKDRFELAGRLKRAYDIRSRFVHDGKVPSDHLKDDFTAMENLVFQTWADIMVRFLPLAEAKREEKYVFDGLLKLKLGASWDEAFPH